MLYRISVTVVSLFKKDVNGVRRYVHIKEHISEHKPGFIGLLTSLFLFIMLINVSLTSSSRLDQIRSSDAIITGMSDTISNLEEEILRSTAHHSLTVHGYEVRLKECVIDNTISTPIPKPPDKKQPNRKFITRELVIDKLKDISD